MAVTYSKMMSTNGDCSGHAHTRQPVHGLPHGTTENIRLQTRDA